MIDYTTPLKRRGRPAARRPVRKPMHPVVERLHRGLRAARRKARQQAREDLDLRGMATLTSFEPITVLLEPLRTVPETNRREHWQKTATRAKEQRYGTYYWLRSILTTPDCVPLPLTITLTRIGVKLLDPDAIAASMKHIADGLADFLFRCPGEGHKYDNDPRLTWQYAQRKGGVGQYAVEIRFSAGTPPPVAESGGQFPR